MNYIVGAFKPPCQITISFSDARTRKQASIKKENGQMMMVPLFQSQENIAGEVSIDPILGKKVEHNGVKIELLGQIELYFDRGNFYDFTSLVRELDVPSEIYEKKTYPFEFSTVEMPYESYNGINVRLRYILRVTVSRNFVSNIVEHQVFWVRNYTPPPTINNSIKASNIGFSDFLKDMQLRLADDCQASFCDILPLVILDTGEFVDFAAKMVMETCTTKLVHFFSKMS